MDVYKIVNNKITDIKTVLNGYVLEENEIEGGSPADLGMILLDGIWQKDPQEIAEQIKQNRIEELKETITNKNYLGDDVTVERTELRALLGL